MGILLGRSFLNIFSEIWMRLCIYVEYSYFHKKIHIDFYLFFFFVYLLDVSMMDNDKTGNCAKFINPLPVPSALIPP